MKKRLVLCLSALVIVAGCGARKVAKGPADIIYVLASDDVKEVVQPAVDSTFSYGVRAPEFQRYFQTDWRPLSEMQEYLYFPHTIVIADMNVNNAASRLVRGLLSKERLQTIQADTVAMFALPDTWQKIQTLILIVGHDTQKLADFVLERQGWLYDKFYAKYVERQSKFLFNQYEQKDLARKLWNRYEWTFRVPSDYMIIHEYPMRKFVWLGRALPYRWISVSWEDGIKTEWLTANGLYEKRQEIGKLYQNIRTEKRFLGHKFVKLNDWEALRMYGLWYHEEKAQGGPFVTYAFYDEQTDRTFVIDLMVYAPGEKVTNYLQHLEIITRTFQTVKAED